MVNLRHPNIKAGGGVPRICKESDVTALATQMPGSTISYTMHRSTESDAATPESRDETFSREWAISNSCVPNIRRRFTSIHKDVQLHLKSVTWMRKKSNKKTSSSKLTRLIMSWKENALATVRSVHVRLVSAHNQQACSAVLLYAHAHIVNLIEDGTKKLQDKDKTWLNALTIIKGLCHPCDRLEANPSRCRAAALACQDFMRLKAAGCSQHQDTT